MSHYVLYVSQDESVGPAWPLDLASRGVVVLTASNMRQAVAYCRAYPLMLALIEIGSYDEAWREGLARIREAFAENSRPRLVGVQSGELTDAERAALAENGLDGLVSRRDPERFVVDTIELLQRLEELGQFEQTRMDVGQLAKSTREQLHELTQPLSAIQGRLQLLAATCPPDDPNAKNLNDLVQLSFKVSNFLAQMQQFHRKFS